MEELHKHVRTARRRLAVQKFLRLASWCCFAVLTLAAIGVLADWYWSFAQMPVGVWLGAGFGIGLLVALVWTWATRLPLMAAAIELDQRFGLRERVSSALSLAPEDLETEPGQAVTRDAIRRVQHVHVPEHFGLSLDRWCWLPMIPALVAVALVFLLPDSPAVQQAKAKALEKEVVQRSAAALQRKLEIRKKQASEQGLTELADLLAKIEKGSQDLAKQQKVDQSKALVELNDLADQLKQKRSKLGDPNELKKQFEQFKDLNPGPADKLADALKEGDLEKAMEEIQDLKDKLAKGELDKQEQQALANQLDQMKQKMEQAVQQHEQKKKELREQIEQAKQAGNDAAAQQLQQQLNQMQSKDGQMQQMQQMADKLNQAAQSLKDGDQQGAQQQLQDMQQQLENLDQEMQEMAMLDDAMQELEQAKNGMCQECRGLGDKQGRGQGRGQGDKPGNGMGEGRGFGDRPEEETDSNFIDTQVKQKVTRGAIDLAGEADGPNRVNQVREEIKSQFDSAESGASDPLTDRNLPKDYREHARSYFNNLREGRE